MRSRSANPRPVLLPSCSGLLVHATLHIWGVPGSLCWGSHTPQAPQHNPCFHEENKETISPYLFTPGHSKSEICQREASWIWTLNPGSWSFAVHRALVNARALGGRAGARANTLWISWLRGMEEASLASPTVFPVFMGLFCLPRQPCV